MIKRHVVRQHVHEWKVPGFVYKKSKELEADMMTKPVPRDQHIRTVKELGIRGVFEEECSNQGEVATSVE